MRLVHSGHDLSEEVASVWLPESPPRPHVAVHVAVARGEHQVDVLLTNNHLLEKNKKINQHDRRDWFYLDWIVFNLDWVDPWVAIHPVVGGQQTLTTGFSTHNLQKQSD